MNKFQYAAPPRCPKCMLMHHAGISCEETESIYRMDSTLATVSQRMLRDRVQHIDDVFMAAICAVCGDMPTWDHIKSMGHVFVSPDGGYSLTWGSPDNVIAYVPPPSYHYYTYGKENTRRSR